jgi:quercetin dioxygenase-like cupin family protein
MRVLRAAEVATLATQVPDTPGEVRPQWLEGPFNADRLDVAMVTVSPGGVTPPHVHLGGQILIVTAGRGFVETDGERCTIEPGDVVVCPPGELHVHGAVEDQPLAHLTVTTGGYRFPDPPPSP